MFILAPFYACWVLATPPHAFFLDVSLDLANPVWRLAYGIFDKIVFGLDLSSIASIESMSSSCTPSCAHDSMALSCARGFKCDYIDTGNPDHDIDHGVPLHGYLDQGCNTHCSRLPRHRNKGYHLA
jgi:hypothetical protein